MPLLTHGVIKGCEMDCFEGTPGWCSGSGRGAACYAAELGALDFMRGEPASGNDVDGSSTAIKREHEHNCGEGLNGMVARGLEKVAALRATLFSGVLHRQEIVADGDDRKQNCDENQDRDNLAAAMGSFMVTDTEPHAHHQNGESGPREIEDNFHLVPQLC